MDRGWYVRFSIVFVCTVTGALALWPSVHAWVPAPKFVQELFKGRMSPGLDIRGGLRLMYEVEVDQALSERRDRIQERLLRSIGQELLKTYDDGEANAEKREKALAETRKRVTLSAVEPPASGDWRCRATVDQVRCQVRGAVPSLGADSPWSCRADASGEAACTRTSYEPDLISMVARFKDQADAEKLDRDFLKEYSGDLAITSRQGKVVRLAIRAEAVEFFKASSVDQTVETVKNRIDELQIREMNVQKRESDIVVEIPGEEKEAFDRVRAIISRTARLEFKIVDQESDFVAGLQGLPAGVERQGNMLVAKGEEARKKLVEYLGTVTPPEGREVNIGEMDSIEPSNQEMWRTYVLMGATDVTGDQIEQAWVGYDDQTQQPIVLINFDASGATAFDQLTGENVGKAMAIVLDDRVESAPTINERIPGGRCRITLGAGPNVKKEADDLVVVLNAGALPAPMRPANEQHVGPALGLDSVRRGAEGAIGGIILVLLFMFIYYEVAGLVANTMVLLNVLLLMGIFAAFEVTLTLPGILGIALTVGMAVDANVLINERIREELRLGKSPRSAVDQGYDRAFWSIFDSQLTTAIAAIVLFQFGTGPIKGFAVTLILGIITSLFTGVFCSKVAMDFLVRGLKVQRLRVG